MYNTSVVSSKKLNLKTFTRDNTFTTQSNAYFRDLIKILLLTRDLFKYDNNISK